MPTTIIELKVMRSLRQSYRYSIRHLYCIRGSVVDVGSFGVGRATGGFRTIVPQDSASDGSETGNRGTNDGKVAFDATQ